MIRVAIQFNNEHFSHMPLNIFLPGLIIISLGISAVWHLKITTLIEWYINQALVVAATVIVNNLPYKGSLTLYAFGEVNRSLLFFSAKSIISKKTFQWLGTIKRSLLDKELVQGLFNQGNPLVRKAAGLVKSSMADTLDYADEVLVSYVWLTTKLYREHGPDGRRPKISKLVKNQAKFFLEGFIHFIRNYPRLVISTILPALAVSVLTTVVTLTIVIVAFFVIGVGWYNALWLLFFFNSIARWVDRVIIQHAHTLIILDKFYKVLQNSKPIDVSTLVSTIGSIPVLASIAQKTGMKEFKDMRFEDTCPSNLMELSSIEEMVCEETERVCALFNVEDASADKDDIEKDPSHEDVTTDENVTEDVGVGEIVAKVEDDDNDDDVFTLPVADVKNVEAVDETVTVEPHFEVDTNIDVSDFSMGDMPTVPRRFVRKFEE